MNEQIDRALRAFDAHDFATRAGGYKESQNPRSREWLMPCRACGSDRLRWHHEPGTKMAWICWGCGRTGDTVDLVALTSGISRFEALDAIVSQYDGGDAPEVLREIARIAPPHRDEVRLAPRIAWPQGFDPLDPARPEHARPYVYLSQRGIDPDDVRRYEIRYCAFGRHAGYVVFPVFMDGALAYWQARATWDPPPGLSGDRRKAWVQATGYRKTLNPAGVPSGGVIFNFDAVRGQPEVVICEGPVDAIKAGPNAVALFGKTAGEAKLERLLRLTVQRYVVYLDAGEEEAAASIALARELVPFAPTCIARPPAGRDPGALTKAQNRTIIAAARPFRAGGLWSSLRAQ